MKAFLTIGIFAILISASPNSHAQQTFSCSFGEPACLDFGAVVCDSLAKCVNKNARCFNPGTCNYQGFVCKSDADQCVEDYNDLADGYDALESDYDALFADYEELLGYAKRVDDCLIAATTLAEAKNCR